MLTPFIFCLSPLRACFTLIRFRHDAFASYEMSFSRHAAALPPLPPPITPCHAAGSLMPFSRCHADYAALIFADAFSLPPWLMPPCHSLPPLMLRRRYVITLFAIIFAIDYAFLLSRHADAADTLPWLLLPLFSPLICRDAAAMP